MAGLLKRGNKAVKKATSIPMEAVKQTTSAKKKVVKEAQKAMPQMIATKPLTAKIDELSKQMDKLGSN